jgi:hypothetical protein
LNKDYTFKSPIYGCALASSEQFVGFPLARIQAR